VERLEERNGGNGMEVVGPQIRLWLGGLGNGERDGWVSGEGGGKWEELSDERERVMLRFLEKVC
jgi:hypothetical protein